MNDDSQPVRKLHVKRKAFASIYIDGSQLQRFKKVLQALSFSTMKQCFFKELLNHFNGGTVFGRSDLIDDLLLRFQILTVFLFHLEHAIRRRRILNLNVELRSRLMSQQYGVKPVHNDDIESQRSGVSVKIADTQFRGVESRSDFCGQIDDRTIFNRETRKRSVKRIQDTGKVKQQHRIAGNTLRPDDIEAVANRRQIGRHSDIADDIENRGLKLRAGKNGSRRVAPFIGRQNLTELILTAWNGRILPLPQAQFFPRLFGDHTAAE